MYVNRTRKCTARCSILCDAWFERRSVYAHFTANTTGKLENPENSGERIMAQCSDGDFLVGLPGICYKIMQAGPISFQKFAI